MNKLQKERKRMLRIRLARLFHPTDEGISVFLYRRALGHKPNLVHPKSFTEKLQWLKLHDATDLKRLCCDKYKVRSYIAETIGEQYLIPTLFVLERADDLDIAKLPNRFVLQCNHDSNSTTIIKDKNLLTPKEWNIIRNYYRLRLRQDYSLAGGEIQYRGIRPLLIVNSFMENSDGTEIPDYKFYCFHGCPKFIQVDIDRHIDHHRILMSPSWEKMHIQSKLFRACQTIPPRPTKLDEMISLATELSKPFPFVRVDLYQCGERVYFGELTFTPANGVEPYTPENADIEIGQWLHLES